MYTHKLSLVNGGWGIWGNWETCPVSCGGGDQGRTRLCDNPAPQHGGDDCTVDGSSASESQRCNENPCPSKSNAIILNIISRIISYIPGTKCVIHN